MSKKMLVDASHSEETRVVVVDGKKVEDFDFESFSKSQLSGNIYLAKVTRVEPSLQAAFLDYGGNRHGFLAFSEVHPDYYQIPIEEQENIAEQTNEDIDEDTTSEDSKQEIALTSETEVENVQKKTLRRYRIQEVIKVRQILLVQIVKEERGNKGAALTTYLSLAGRYCVLMPNTAKGGGISRKITNLVDRKRLKEIANSLSISDGAGLIIRTAGSNRTKIEIKRDYEYLLRQWEQVRELTMKSIAPTPIYEEGSLIKRCIRDLYSRDVSEVLVEGDRGYREAKDYMKMLMPSHAKNVKKYEGEMPLFFNFEIEDHLAAMFNPVVQLKSGGYIVIGVTEALVAVDVNSGRATKESSIEDTALKTNLEAADELARQLKLRDLAGLIVIDFIDMEERKNNFSVEKRMKERLKSDRARTQVGRISTFGLLEMSRQRLRPGMIETTTQACTHCHGTGITRSDDSLALAIFRELEEEGLKNKLRSLTVRVPLKVANYMLNEKREHISILENRYSVIVKIEADSTLVSPTFIIDTIKENIPNSKSNKKNSKLIDDSDIKIVSEGEELDKKSPNKPSETIDETAQKKKRRRRRRPKSARPETSSTEEIGNKTIKTFEKKAEDDESFNTPVKKSTKKPDTKVKTSIPLKNKSSSSVKTKTQSGSKKELPAEEKVLEITTGSQITEIVEDNKLKEKKHGAARGQKKTEPADKKFVDDSQGSMNKDKVDGSNRKETKPKIGWWSKSKMSS